MSIYYEVGISQLTKDKEELCGDSVAITNAGRAKVLVMSDGLGSGVKANILSSLTTKMASTMLKKGSGVDEVIETLAGTLPVCRVRKLAYSTFTILKLDDNGKTYVAEYDNPRCIVIKKGEVWQVPVNLREVHGRQISEASFDVEPGDWLIAVSDGVLHAGIGGVWNLGWGEERVTAYVKKLAVQDLTAVELGQNLTSLCDKLYGGQPGDDVSVVVVKVREPETVSMMVGPPADKKDDEIVVNKLLQSPGKRVVCGGTTGNMVSRITGKELLVDLDSSDANIPPVATMEGIDLTTEGMLTLVKTLDLFKTGITPSKLVHGRDGASRLARVLLSADTIHMIVGRAINPAHQSPDVPSVLALKSQLVDELIRQLRKQKKKVSVEYH